MLELLTGAGIALLSLLIGFNLGKHSAPLSPALQKKYHEIINRVAPPSDVGAVIRPTSREREVMNNPKLAQEQQIMGDTFKDVINS